MQIRKWWWYQQYLLTRHCFHWRAKYSEDNEAKRPSLWSKRLQQLSCFLSQASKDSEDYEAKRPWLWSKRLPILLFYFHRPESFRRILRPSDWRPWLWYKRLQQLSCFLSQASKDSEDYEAKRQEAEASIQEITTTSLFSFTGEQGFRGLWGQEAEALIQ
jgi:hypothetical protein